MSQITEIPQFIETLMEKLSDIDSALQTTEDAIGYCRTQAETVHDQLDETLNKTLAALDVFTKMEGFEDGLKLDQRIDTMLNALLRQYVRKYSRRDAELWVTKTLDVIEQEQRDSAA